MAGDTYLLRRDRAQMSPICSHPTSIAHTSSFGQDTVKTRAVRTSPDPRPERIRGCAPRGRVAFGASSSA
jgi:hypothetical protein